MKAYAPSDRGTSAAVVVSQELLTATVTGLQPTKEREKASIIFFVCQIFLLTAMVQPRREKASTMFFFVSFLYHFILCCMSILPGISLIHLVNTKTKQKP